jgi:branched-chain amino acid transport system permease protein
MGMTWVLGQQMWNGFVAGMAYVLFAMGLNLIFGVLGVINMAHGEVFMIGAMLVWTLISFLELNFFLATFLSVLIVAALGVAFDRVAVRPLIEADPLIIMLSTMAMSVIFMYGAMTVWNVDARVIVTPFKGKTMLFGTVITNASLVLCSMGFVTLGGLHLFLTKTTTGKLIRATAQDRIGAHLVGINVKWVYAFTMSLASALAAIAGAIVGPIWVAFPAMGQDMLPKGFAIVVVSGLGNLWGCVITGLLLGITEGAFTHYVSLYFRDAYVFGIMILACLLRPQGLFRREQ